jgi:hypothetical protein
MIDAKKLRWGIALAGILVFSIVTALSIGAQSTAPAVGQPALYLTAIPKEIPVGGVAQSTINATVWDGEGWIQSGPLVNFSTDRGSITASASIENGTATATLTAGTTPGLATFTAAVNLHDIELLTNTTTVEFEASEPPLPNVPALYLTANPSEIPADGVATSTINASVWVWDEYFEEYFLIWSGPDVNFSTDLGEITASAMIEEGAATATLTAGTTPGVATITAEVTPSEDIGLLTNTTTVCFTATAFDTGAGTYPSMSGMHNGTITPSCNITVSKLYTYPCLGTGGHTEYIRIWNITNWNVTATWNGYKGDWLNISFDEPFTLLKDETYNYTIRTGSYPQIIHKQNHTTLEGSLITCGEFIDANGKKYDDWIAAIKLWS